MSKFFDDDNQEEQTEEKQYSSSDVGDLYNKFRNQDNSEDSIADKNNGINSANTNTSYDDINKKTNNEPYSQNSNSINSNAQNTTTGSKVSADTVSTTAKTSGTASSAAAEAGAGAAGAGAGAGLGIAIAIIVLVLMIFAIFYAFATSKTVTDIEDYEKSMETDKEIIDELFEKSYDNAIEKLESTCKEKGYDWDQVKGTLNVDSWEDLYKDCNYGDLIAVLSLGYSNGIYGDADDDGTYNIENFKDYLYKEETLENFVYLKFESTESGYTVYHDYEGEKTNDVTLTEEQEKLYKQALKKYTDSLKGKNKLPKPYRSDFYKVEEYVYEIKGNATLYPYCMHQMYDMLGLDPDAYYKDGNDDILSNADMKDVILTQLEVFCENNEELYKSMNFDKETPWENDLYGTSLSDALAGIASIDMGEFDTGEWYSAYNTSGKTSLATTYEGWLKMYSAPTCESSSNTYFVNIPKIKEDTFGYISSATGDLKHSAASTSWCSYEFSSLKTLHGISWQNGIGNCGVYNDRYLVAVGPGIVYNEYYGSTGGVGNNASWYQYGNKKMDIVLQNNTSGEIVYVPITTGDAKGHSYPFGVYQTGIATPGSTTAQMHGSDFKSDTAISNIGTASDPQNAINTYNQRLKSLTGYDISQWLLGGPIEWCCPGTSKTTASARIGSLNSHFSLVGVIVY